MLSELILYVAVLLAGDGGLIALHAAAAVAGLLALSRDALALRARAGSVAIVLLIVFAGAATTFLIARLQLFSLLLLPVLLLLLRAEARRPSRLVWLVPCLLGLWSNLHGGVLLGLALALTYLAFSRFRVEPAVAVGVSGLSALSMTATPAGLATIDYYRSVAENASAQMHVGLWARLSPTSPFDHALVLGAALLLVLFLRTRPPAWEVLSVAGLALATAMAARNGVWLLFLLAPRAALGLRLPQWRAGRVLAHGVMAAGLVCAGLGMLRGPSATGAGEGMVTAAATLSQRCALQADGPLSEQVALAGGKVWMSNPLDAFPPEEQRAYVRWLETGSTALIPAQVSAVFVREGTPGDQAVRADPAYRRVSDDATSVLYVRDGSCSRMHT